MRRACLFVTIALLLVVRVPAHADDLLLGLFGSYLESLRVQAGIPGLAAAIVGENDVVWERAFGQQNVERFEPARTDTPFHLDGLTEIFTSVLVLQCVEQGRLSLDDRIGDFNADSPDAGATIREVLSHTSGSAGNVAYAYRPDRLDPLAAAVRRCTDNSYRETLATLLARLAMTDSVPGPDVIRLVPPAEGIPDGPSVERYTAVLGRLATPYAGRSAVSQYPVTTLKPSGGLISTVRDMAKLDVALRQGLLLQPETLAAAWRVPLDRAGKPLPHALGWFVQTYNGEPIVWQFGVGDNASSSLVLTAPAHRLTFVLMANSDALVKPFAPAAGDVTVSPFAQLFLRLIVR